MGSRAPFTRDQPIDLADDAFGHRDYTDALLSIVEDDAPPPTIGLFGPWGVGKSTIIGGLQTGLRHSGIAFVYFDAWRYDGDPLRRQFLIEAANQLDADGRLIGSYRKDAELDELHIDRAEITETLGLSLARFARAAVIGLLFAAVAAILLALGVFDRVLSGNFGTDVLASVVAFTVGTFAGLFSQAIVVRPTTVSHRALQDPDRFAEKFATLLRSLKVGRVVIAIDNLDRCSPDNAVELLGTIKTYLEPAVAGDSPPRSTAAASVDKEVVFVISVDDQALRRHLLTQEETRSGADRRHDLRRYVDDYLAKFFAARLPIRPILGDDMRGYIASHLAALVDARRLDPSEGRELTSIVSVGFKRTPRAVKQFSNDLESRLRLLEERERQIGGRPAGISPAVSGEVCMVAKLALIESEWPDAFSHLLGEPRLLAGWEEEAESALEVDWRPEHDRSGSPPGQDATARRDFATFLRQARSVQSTQIAALLKLKQSAHEVAPGFAEFRAAVITSDRARVEEILDENEDAGGLVAQLPQILGEEIDSGFSVNARAVLDIVVSVSALEPFEEARKAVLVRAARDPRLRGQLALLDPQMVLSSLDLLGAADRTRLIDPFVARLGEEGLEQDARRAAADALVPHVNELSAAQRNSIGEVISRDPSDFPLYRGLGEADPELLPGGVAAAALAALRTPVAREDSPDYPEETHPSLSAAPNAMALAVLVIGHSSEPDTEADAIQHVADTLADQIESEEPEIEQAIALLEPLGGVEPARWSQLLEEIAARWNGHPRSTHARLIDFVARYLPRATPEMQESIPTQIAAALFEDPANGTAICAETDPVPAPFIAPLLDQLVGVAADPSYFEVSIGPLKALAGDAAAERLADATISVLAAGRQDLAATALTRDADLLAPELPRIAAAGAPQLGERLRLGESLDGGLLLDLADQMTDEAAETFATAMVECLATPGPAAVALEADACLREYGEMPLRTRFVEGALDALTALGEVGPANDQLLAAVAADVALLDTNRQDRLASKLATWLSVQPGQALLLAGRIATMEGLAAGPAKALVDALIAAERATPESPDARREFLEAAYAIGGARRSRARGALRSRLEEFTDGSEFERDLADRLSD